MATHFLRYKSDAKRGIKYTVMVTGSSGTGKSTFVNALLDTNLLPHKYSPIGSSIEEPTVLQYTGNSTQTHEPREFNPLREYIEPTISITSSNIEIVDDDGSKILLTVLDTPGFGANIDNEICFAEIVEFLKRQFDNVLAEETRIKRNPKFEDTRVHICLYFIEATGHGLRELDVEAIKKLSKYVNVLPIISKADSFTPTELQAFKKNILYDIEKYSVPVFEFNYDEAEDDPETIQENSILKKLQPFAVIGSQEKYQIGNELKFARKYPWGLVDVEKNSDFLKVKNVIFGSHLQDFKDLTTNFLYENYRSEKLSYVTHIDESTTNFDTTAPSLSNLAALTSSSSDQGSIRTPRGSFSSTNRPVDINSSPIKEISKSIKLENESIISSIKNSPKVPYSPDPNRNQLRVISETVPYVLKHENIIQRQQRLQELEEKSARELALRAAALEKKAAELKKREKLIKNGFAIKKEETLTDLSSIVNEER